MTYTVLVQHTIPPPPRSWSLFLQGSYPQSLDYVTDPLTIKPPFPFFSIYNIFTPSLHRHKGTLHNHPLPVNFEAPNILNACSLFELSYTPKHFYPRLISLELSLIKLIPIINYQITSLCPSSVFKSTGSFNHNFMYL
jgi:hypothetical protein